MRPESDGEQDDGLEDRFDPVERGEDRPADAQPQRECDAWGAGLERSLQEEDGEDHAQSDIGDGADHGVHVTPRRLAPPDGQCR